MTMTERETENVGVYATMDDDARRNREGGRKNIESESMWTREGYVHVREGCRLE